MVSKSSNLANQNFRLKTRTPRRRLPLPSIFKGLALDSLSCSPAAESPQTSVLNLATYASPASCDHANATSGWALQAEALPFLGRIFKRFLDLLLASIALVLLWPLMLVIAIAVSLESPPGPVILTSSPVAKRGRLLSSSHFRPMLT